MMHLDQWPSIGIVDFDSRKHNLGIHQHCSLAIGHEQNTASQGGRHDIHILTGSGFESLARTSKIYHLWTVQQDRIRFFTII
jgi:hypothetical protein